MNNPNDPKNNRWLHSDIKNVAFPFVHKVFERICTDGGFNPETNNTSIEADTSRNLLNPRDLGFPP